LLLYLAVAIVALWTILHGMYVDGDGSASTADSCLQQASNETGTDPNSKALDVARELADLFGIGDSNSTEVVNFETLAYVSVQLITPIAILTRWLMPVVNLNKDELSSLLSSSLAMAFDIVEFQNNLHEDSLKGNTMLSYVVLVFTSLSLIQLAQLSQLLAPRAAKSDSWEAFWTVYGIIFQEIPFLSIRIYIITKEGLAITDLIFPLKNSFGIVFGIYHTYVLLKTKKKATEEKRRSSAGLPAAEKDIVRSQRKKAFNMTFPLLILFAHLGLLIWRVVVVHNNFLYCLMALVILPFIAITVPRAIQHKRQLSYRKTKSTIWYQPLLIYLLASVACSWLIVLTQIDNRTFVITKTTPDTEPAPTNATNYTDGEYFHTVGDFYPTGDTWKEPRPVPPIVSEYTEGDFSPADRRTADMVWTETDGTRSSITKTTLPVLSVIKSGTFDSIVVTMSEVRHRNSGQFPFPTNHVAEFNRTTASNGVVTSYSTLEPVISEVTVTASETRSPNTPKPSLLISRIVVSSRTPAAPTPDSNRQANAATSPTSGLTSDCENSTDIRLGDATSYGLVQLILPIAIFVRWWLPRDNMSHKDFSSLLQLALASAFDIAEFFHLLVDLPALHEHRTLVILVMTFTSTGLLLLAEIDIGLGSQNSRNKYGLVSQSPRIIWTIFSILFLDGPFFVVRVLIIVTLGTNAEHFQLVFLLKNAFAVIFGIYDIVTHRKLVRDWKLKKQEEETAEEGHALTLTNFNASKVPIERNLPDPQLTTGTMPGSQPMPGPQPSPGTLPGPQPMPGTVPGPQPMPGTLPHPQPSPGTLPGPQPMPGTVPGTLLHPQPMPGPQPSPGTLPGPQPMPGTVPGPQPMPGTLPHPQPSPGTLPGPQPMPGTVPGTLLHPQPMPGPQPSPGTLPDPQPIPGFQPVPDTLPDSQPMPGTLPGPQPMVLPYSEFPDNIFVNKDAVANLTLPTSQSESSITSGGVSNALYEAIESGGVPNPMYEAVTFEEMSA
jgi:hypothetical protein